MIDITNYSKTITKSIFTSKFIYWEMNELTKINQLQIAVENKKIKKLHFFYLYLLSGGRKPYLLKASQLKKNKSQKKPINAVSTKLSITYKNRFFWILKKIIFDIIPYQPATENQIFFITPLFLKLKFWNAPLTKDTYKLRAANGFVPNITLSVKLKFNNDRLFEHIFFLRFFKLLNNKKIKDIDKC